jgi:hypothetical protein
MPLPLTEANGIWDLIANFPADNLREFAPVGNRFANASKPYYSESSFSDHKPPDARSFNEIQAQLVVVKEFCFLCTAHPLRYPNAGIL